jgi:DNA-directed RNA polymerase specialized sigma24 family protein
MASLNPDQARCIFLRYFADYSVAETAAFLGITEGSVKGHTWRALAALREALDGRVTR